MNNAIVIPNQFGTPSKLPEVLQNVYNFYVQKGRYIALNDEDATIDNIYSHLAFFEYGMTMSVDRMEMFTSDPKCDKFVREQLRAWTKEIVGYKAYYHETSRGWRCWLLNEEETIIYGTAMLMSIHSNNVTAFVTAWEDYAHLLQDMLRGIFKKTGIKVTRVLGVGPQGVQTTTDYLFDDGATQVAKPSFYPMITDINGLLNDYLESKENVLMLLGQPGTGKTTLLRTLVMRSRRSTLWVPVSDMNSLEAILAEVKNGAYELVIFEDADNMLGKREDGNSPMSSLLSSIDGLVGTKTKFVISTNLATLSKVDSALIRPGRCFEVIHFNLLTPEQANAAREELEMEHVEFENDVSLADALTSSKVKYYTGETIHTKTRSMGF